jgi:hypothetical protein
MEENKLQQFVNNLVESIDNVLEFETEEEKKYFYENIIDIILSSDESEVQNNINKFLEENYELSDEVRGKLNEGVISAIGSGIGSVFSGVGKGIGAAVRGIGSGIKSVGKGVGAAAKGIGAGIRNIFAGPGYGYGRYYDSRDKIKKTNKNNEKEETSDKPTPKPGPTPPPVSPKPTSDKVNFVGYTPTAKDYEGEIPREPAAKSGIITKPKDFDAKGNIPYSNMRSDVLNYKRSTGFTPKDKVSLSPSMAAKFREERRKRKLETTTESSTPPSGGKKKPSRPLGSGKTSGYGEDNSEPRPVRGNQPGRLKEEPDFIVESYSNFLNKKAPYQQ